MDSPLVTADRPCSPRPAVAPGPRVRGSGEVAWITSCGPGGATALDLLQPVRDDDRERWEQVDG